jgi:hypothetical protein
MYASLYYTVFAPTNFETLNHSILLKESPKIRELGISFRIFIIYSIPFQHKRDY